MTKDNLIIICITTVFIVAISFLGVNQILDTTTCKKENASGGYNTKVYCEERFKNDKR